MADQLKWLNAAILDELVPNKKAPGAFKIPETHDDLLFYAKLAEQAERYDEMVLSMRTLVKINPHLNDDARNLLAVAYKNVIGPRRNAWRNLTMMEQRSGEDQTSAALRKQLEAELAAACDDLLQLLDKYLIPEAQGSEPKVFFLKLKGDYHRYYAEVANADAQKKAALDAYEAAMTIADGALPPTHATRLGLVLNLSVFHYEIMKQRDQGYALAKKVYDEASTEMETLADEQYRESSMIVQLLRDNLQLWKEDMKGEAAPTA
jgi:14-3-3 protein epsilon